MEQFDSFRQLVSTLADIKGILGVGAIAATLTVFGGVPRIGIGRSVVLAFKPLLSSLSVKSVRQNEIDTIRSELRLLPDKGNYIVVTGSKGVGKSCLIETALQYNFGVIKVHVSSGQTNDAIVLKVLKAVTNIQNNFFDPVPSAKRVVFFYNLFFRSSPIVLISVPEHTLVTDKYAELTSTTRFLVDGFGFRVIVDGSPNSIPPSLKTTTREIIVDVDFMTREVIETIPEFKDLFCLLKDHNIDNTVWHILGGSPSLYGYLDRLRRKGGKAVLANIKAYAHLQLTKAHHLTTSICSENTKRIISAFRTLGYEDKMPMYVLASQNLFLDSPNKVFKEVVNEAGVWASPSTPAIGLILRGNISDTQDVNKLWEVLCENNVKYP